MNQNIKKLCICIIRLATYLNVFLCVFHVNTNVNVRSMIYNHFSHEYKKNRASSHNSTLLSPPKIAHKTQQPLGVISCVSLLLRGFDTRYFTKYIYNKNIRFGNDCFQVLCDLGFDLIFATSNKEEALLPVYINQEVLC